MSSNLIGELESVLGSREKVLVVFEFILAFSRFEFALKRAQFFKKNQEDAEVDWNRVKNEFTAKASDEVKRKISEDGTYIWGHPPKKQIIEKNRLDWKPAPERSGSIREAIEALQRIRNNLFHGGKWPDGPEYTPERDLNLISTGLHMLNQLVEVDESVRGFFHERF